MRLSWLSGVAVAALMVSPVAIAQQVKTDEPFTVKISGFQQAAMQSVTNTPAPTGNSELNSLMGASRTRIIMAIDAKSGNLAYGGQIRTNYYNNTAQTDNGFIKLDHASYGRLMVGTFGAAIDAAGFDGSMTWGMANFTGFVTDGGWGAHVANLGVDAVALAQTQDLVDGNTNATRAGKIIYYSPVISGFQLKASYAPNALTGTSGTSSYPLTWTGDRSKTTSLASNGLPKAYDTAYEVGATYNDTLGGVKLSLGADYLGGTPKALADKRKLSELSAYGARIGATWQGVMAQFVYNGAGSSNLLSALADGTALTGPDQAGFSGSLAYAFGPAQVGFYYASGTRGNNNAVNFSTKKLGSFKVTAMGGGGSYNLAKGIQGFVGYEQFAQDAEDKATFKLLNSKASVITVGMGLAF